jgi:phospholipase C
MVDNTQKYSSIQHVVVIMQENHSFDNYFALFPNANGLSNYPDFAKKLAHPISYVTHDLCHSHRCALQYYNNGKMDGWTDIEAFGYYNSTELSYYWQLAKNYTLMDNYFSDFMGPTLPNRIFSVAGDNFGLTTNFGSNYTAIGSINSANIFDILTERNISWTSYVPCHVCSLDPLSAFKNDSKYIAHERNPEEIFTDIKEGKLASVVYYATPEIYNEHPVSSSQQGMEYVKRVVDSIIASKFWDSTVIIITYDEFGGFYDHVPPPNSNYGFRVPAILVSPFAKRGFVDHTFYSHSSILAFIESVFNLPCMHRDCNSNNFLNSLTLKQSYSIYRQSYSLPFVATAFFQENKRALLCS